MRASEVLDAHGDLLDRLRDTRFQKVIGALGEFEFGRSGGVQQKSDHLAEMLERGLRVAETYRVSHDMSMVVEHAAAGLDGLDRIDHNLAPSGCGFVAFDRPLPVHDARGKTMLIHYLVWGPVRVNDGSRHATLMVAFNDRWRQPDQVGDELRESFIAEAPSHRLGEESFEEYLAICGRWATVGATPIFDDQRLGPAAMMPSEAHAAQILAEGMTPTEGTNVTRYIHALWLLMGQTVAKVETEDVDRPARRRAKKMKLPPKVTVIKLRRETSDTERREGESLVEWAHRWVVRGHWRWQAVSAHHPLAQEIEPGKYRARIWINPFVKGPTDKPFVQSQKVYSLER